jgi:type II secretory pathway pseudopilin PulG
MKVSAIVIICLVIVALTEAIMLPWVGFVVARQKALGAAEAARLAVLSQQEFYLDSNAYHASTVVYDGQEYVVLQNSRGDAVSICPKVKR